MATFNEIEAARWRDLCLRAKNTLQRIVDHYDMRAELYTSDADLAAGMATIARQALSEEN